MRTLAWYRLRAPEEPWHVVRSAGLTWCGRRTYRLLAADTHRGGSPRRDVDAPLCQECVLAHLFKTPTAARPLGLAPEEGEPAWLTMFSA